RHGRHRLVSGAGYTISSDDVRNSIELAVDPDERTDETSNIFIEDRYAIIEDELFFTLGTKLEHNDYTGVEHQPTARLAWSLDPDTTLWTSVSRAVRVPSRLEADT